MFKPLLSPRNDPLNTPTFFEDLTYPCILLPKLDGIRGIGKKGTIKSRTYKDLPSNQVHELFSKCQGMDGELIVGSPTAPDVYNKCQSHIMSFDKPHEELTFNVFDWAGEERAAWTYKGRYNYLKQMVLEMNDPRVKLVEAVQVDNLQQLLYYEEKCLIKGYEGIMWRNPLSPYKHGRATYLQNIIKKIKRPVDEEAVVVGFYEQMTNTNEQKDDELGYAKRSHHLANQVPSGTLGGFICMFKDTEIRVGCGQFNHAQRLEIWMNQSKYLYKILRWRHFPKGAKDLPRQPRALGWWSPEHAS